MIGYDFKALHDKEFESLCVDLLGVNFDRRIERFKAGKDKGVDGRYFASDGSEVIFQFKHWAGTATAKLVSRLRTDERPKVERLKPKRYVLAVSNPLSRTEKKGIRAALGEQYIAEHDIFGQEDLNDLLLRHPDVERRHYKLWLQSASVISNVLNSAILGRSEFALSEIHEKSRRYVFTKSHGDALSIIERTGVVLISGEPGVGKTTLAEQLCLGYAADGYKLVVMSDDIAESEAILGMEPDSKQLFYFDDFLGRNYLEAVLGNEGAQITQFIRRIARNKNKRLILTSRTNILSQGLHLSDLLEHENVQRNKHELSISELTDAEKALILYSHIWHSGLDSSYIDELYSKKRYREIVRHKNFNPRLIQFLTDITRLDGVPPADYWCHIEDSLANPSRVWAHPFEAQEDDFSRALIKLAVLSRPPVPERTLARAFARYCALPQNQGMQGRRDFSLNARLLVGSFLRRTMSAEGSAIIDLFNPAVGDFVVSVIGRDVEELKRLCVSLGTGRSLVSVSSFARDKLISEEERSEILWFVLRTLDADAFHECNESYIAAVGIQLLREVERSGVARKAMFSRAVLFVLNSLDDYTNSDELELIIWGLESGVVTQLEALKFVENRILSINQDDEIECVGRLLAMIDSSERVVAMRRAIASYVTDVMMDNLSEFVDAHEFFSGVEDDEWLEENFVDRVREKLADLGVEIEDHVVDRVVSLFDVRYEFRRFVERERGDDHYEPGMRHVSAFSVGFDPIDDVFDRT